MATPKSGSDVKVLLLDPIHEFSLTAFEQAHFQVVECFEELTEGQLANKISDYHIICLRNRIITDEVLKSAHRLLAIGVFGQHASSVDINAAQSLGIPVFTAPYQHQHSVAEFIIASIVLLSRKVPDQSRQIHDGIWNKVSKGCHEVRNKTLGIVGYGNVGSQLGVLAEALSLRVIFYDNQSIMPIGRAQPMDSLSDLLKESDFVSICVSSTPENKNLFSTNELEKMKPSSYLLNSSYGSAVDLHALAASIKAGHIAGAAIDVFPDNYKEVNCLKDIPNVILSDGLAPNTIECATRIVQEVTRSIVQYMNFGSSVGSVNYPSIAAWPLKPGTRRVSFN
jgi:D-3-phosphoglycerate dehydrogenase